MGHATTEVSLQDPGSLKVSTGIKTLYSIFIFVGLLTFAMTIANDQARAWHAYLIGFFYVLSLALGGLFLTAIHHTVKAGWSVNVRRFFESYTSFLPLAFITGLVLVFAGAGHLYDWLNPEIVASDKLIKHKAPYLNQTFFILRFVFFFITWIIFSKILVGNSIKQDETGDESLITKLARPAVGCLLAFAVTYSFFTVDLLMSLEAHWFSTIIGVYTFAGMFQTTIAITILLINYMGKKGLLRGLIDENHLHDLGKFLFAFTVFWAYIAFSQFMLIWYANIPEETLFYIPRSQGSWSMVTASLIIFKFIVPFLALLPQWAKRNINHLSAVAILILIMQYVDIYWLVYPNFNEESVVFGISEIGIFLGFVGLFIFTVTRFLSKHSIVPYRDPRVHESVHHHVVY